MNAAEQRAHRIMRENGWVRDYVSLGETQNRVKKPLDRIPADPLYLPVEQPTTERL